MLLYARNLPENSKLGMGCAGKQQAPGSRVFPVGFPRCKKLGITIIKCTMIFCYLGMTDFGFAAGKLLFQQEGNNGITKRLGKL